MRINRIIMAAVAVLALACAPAARAQFRYGPMVGANISNLSFKQSDILTPGRTAGFSAGLGAEMMFPGIGFGLDLGLYYDMRGAKLDMGKKPIWSSQGITDGTLRLHYVVLPFHLKFKYTRLNGFEEKLAPMVYAGPTFGFVVGHSKNPALEYPGGEMGLEFGVGAEIFQHWQLTASYNLGMTYTVKAKVLTNYSARNRSWGLRLAYLF